MKFFLAVRRLWKSTFGRLLIVLLVGLIRLYQKLISPLFGPVCRYYPTCSHYAVQSVTSHGAIKGILLSAWRILRCNPWSAGGIDEVPEPGSWSNPKVIEVSTNIDGQVGRG